MNYISELIGSFIFLVGGYTYMCNISLKDTLIQKLNYIELVLAWGLSVAFGLTVAIILGGPAYLNPSVVVGNLILGNINLSEALKYIAVEFLAAMLAVLFTNIFFKDSFKETKTSTRGIFAAYPIKRNIPLNFFQEFTASFLFIFILLLAISITNNPICIGALGFASVSLLALTLNSTGFSMNAMRSLFSSIWYKALKGKNKVDWEYQIIVNGLGSTLGGALATVVATLIK